MRQDTSGTVRLGGPTPPRDSPCDTDQPGEWHTWAPKVHAKDGASGVPVALIRSPGCFPPDFCGASIERHRYRRDLISTGWFGLPPVVSTLAPSALRSVAGWSDTTHSFFCSAGTISRWCEQVRTGSCQSALVHHNKNPESLDLYNQDWQLSCHAGQSSPKSGLTS